MKHKKHLWFLVIGLIMWLSVAVYGYTQTTTAASDLETVTIGYQKADPVDIARQHGELIKKRNMAAVFLLVRTARSPISSN